MKTPAGVVVDPDPLRWPPPGRDGATWRWRPGVLASLSD
jgi:hypothetical protein